MKLKALLVLALLGLLFTAQAEARFPEFGFCPLGGLPGWINRMNGQSHRYYPPQYQPPPYPARSTYLPYRVYAYPPAQFSPQIMQKTRSKSWETKPGHSG